MSRYSSRCIWYRVIAGALSVLFLGLPALLYAQNLVPTPPLGWSEWDSYGLTITEADFRANAAVLASLRQYGWQYAMLDAGWYEDNPTSSQTSDRHYQLVSSV